MVFSEITESFCPGVVDVAAVFRNLSEISWMAAVEPMATRDRRRTGFVGKLDTGTTPRVRQLMRKSTA